MKNISIIIASYFGVGYLRPASATWGSLATALTLYPFWPEMSIQLKLMLCLLAFILGILSCRTILKDTKLHDPHYIVIDETLGMMLASLFLGSNVWHWLVAFLLFRIFDIAKLWPASYFDKRPGALSIMMDDIIMAIPVGALLLTIV